MDARLVAYVDGELDATAAAEVEALIATDAAVRADVAMFRETAMLLRAACGEQHFRQAPAGSASLARRAGRPLRRVALATAAAVLLTLGGVGAGLWWHAPKPDELLDEVAEYHAVYSRETTHLAEVPASRAPEFAQWMGERLDTRIAVPDLRQAGLTFAGGRMLVIDERPVADLLYTRAQGAPVALCIAREATAAAAAGIAVTERDSLRLAYWGGAGLTYVVVGALDAVAARRIADLAAPQI